MSAGFLKPWVMSARFMLEYSMLAVGTTSVDDSFTTAHALAKDSLFIDAASGAHGLEEFSDFRERYLLACEESFATIVIVDNIAVLNLLDAYHSLSLFKMMLTIWPFSFLRIRISSSSGEPNSFSRSGGKETKSKASGNPSASSSASAPCISARYS